jgi:hypothetical protein
VLDTEVHFILIKGHGHLAEASWENRDGGRELIVPLDAGPSVDVDVECGSGCSS